MQLVVFGIECLTGSLFAWAETQGGRGNAKATLFDQFVTFGQ